MTTTVPIHDPAQDRDHQQKVAALAQLLAAYQLPDICAWFIRDTGVEGQLDAGYSDVEAYARIEELAGCLRHGNVNIRPLRTDQPTITAVKVVVEARGAIDTVPFRFWTHLDDLAATVRDRQVNR